MKIRLNSEQNDALASVQAFIRDDSLDAFILRGSAGTGKTTLIAKLVQVLAEAHATAALLAPTGRAARILGNKVRATAGNIGYRSKTIHAEIYSLRNVIVNEEAKAANDPGMRMIFPLKQDEPSASLFVIDESSMIGNKDARGDLVQFGSGRLLTDLLEYARTKRPGQTTPLTKVLFVGDAVQLPPVTENFSPALSEQYLHEEFGLRVAGFDLETVMRQAEGSQILARATEIRDAVIAGRFNDFSLQPNELDIRHATTTEALDLIIEGIQGKRPTVAVVQSNALARDYNRSIRERLWGDADQSIQVGDILLVNKNSTTHGLSNGDLVKVTRVGEPEHVVVPIRGGHQPELHFRDVTVAFRDSDGTVVQESCRALENLLDSPHRELEAIEVRALLVHFRMRHPDLRPHSDEFRATLKFDPYFNALQVKYGYAMTCHKSQGGEWDTAIVDFSMSGGTRNANFFRWVYTAITRAKKALIVVNPPNFTATSNITWAAASPPRSETPQPSLEELSADPDWNRLSFSTELAPLMVLHQQLRSVWKAQDIEIVALQHLQYCERYTLSREDKRAVVQYYYNGKLHMGKATAVTSASSDNELVANALLSMYALASGTSAESTEPFITEFLDRLDAALDSTAIRRTHHSSLPYRLRVAFTDEKRNGEIDFSYNGKSAWTSAQEVGGPGATDGLYEEVQCLMVGTGDAG